MKFKIGDIVYSIKNSQWSGVPLTVVSIDANLIIVNHPLWGFGAFREEDVKLDPISRSPLYEALK